MRRFIFLVALLYCYVQVYAQTTVNIKFDFKDFQLSQSANLGSVKTTLGDIKVVGDTLDPALPYFPCRLLIPENISQVKCDISFDTVLVSNNITLLGNPPASRTRQGRRVPASRSVESPVVLEGIVNMGSYRYFYLKVTPFVYDAYEKNLFFSSIITLTFPELPIGSYDVSYNSIDNKVLLSTHKIENSRLFVNEESIPPVNQDAILPIGIYYPMLSEGNPIEYLIITNNSLATSFNNLITWKHNKALNTKIVTTDSIDIEYPDNCPLEKKIKRCIYDHYVNHGTKWVLLGGDETIIPVKYCFINYGDNLAPTDLYYACFNGNFDWDANQNTLSGELSDSVDFYPQVYLTRIPVNTSQQVLDYTQKIIDYEQGMINDNRLLLAGYSFGEEDYSETVSDAQQLTEMVYEDYIFPYWDNPTYKLFDKSSDLPNDDSYLMTGQTLYNEIERGYHFILENSHGNIDHYSVDDLESRFYTNDYAQSQTNYPGSIIVTGACLTNRFDAESPCLSEILLRNPNGGAVSYFGTSRWGYGAQGDSVHLRYPQYSDLYNGLFYRNLFSNYPTNAPRSFGAVSTQAKIDMIEDCLTYTFNRELQMSINPMGEPEMQIYTETPKHFGIDAPLPLMGRTPEGYCFMYLPSATCKVAFLADHNLKYSITMLLSGKVLLPQTDGMLVVQKENFVPMYMRFSPTSSHSNLALELSSHSNEIRLSIVINNSDENRLHYALSNNDEWSFTISNAITGQIVYEDRCSASQCHVFTSGWQQGLYIVNAIVNGSSLTGKIYIK